MTTSHQPPATDECLQNVRNYIYERRFDQAYVLTCVADIARHTGYNPRTVELRVKQLLDSAELTQVDSYPRKGRPTVHVFRLNHDGKLPCPNPPSSD